MRLLAARRTAFGVFAFSGLVGLAACAQGEAGALEQVELSATCSDDDVGCADLGLSAPLAVGATLDVDLGALGPGQALPLASLESALPEVLEVAGATLSARARGISALLVVAEDGRVVDLFHVAAEEADRLDVVRADDPRPIEGPLQLLVGDELVIVASPSFAGQRLAGQATIDWSIDDPEVGVLLATGHPAERRFVARAPGAITIAAAGLGLATGLSVEVLP